MSCRVVNLLIKILFCFQSNPRTELRYYLLLRCYFGTQQLLLKSSASSQFLKSLWNMFTIYNLVPLEVRYFEAPTKFVIFLSLRSAVPPCYCLSRLTYLSSFGLVSNLESSCVFCQYSRKPEKAWLFKCYCCCNLFITCYGPDKG